MISLTVTLSLKLGRYSASFIGNRPPFTVSIDKNLERTRSVADGTDVISGNRAAASVALLSERSSWGSRAHSSPPDPVRFFGDHRGLFLGTGVKFPPPLPKASDFGKFSARYDGGPPLSPKVIGSIRVLAV